MATRQPADVSLSILTSAWRQRITGRASFVLSHDVRHLFDQVPRTPGCLDREMMSPVQCLHHVTVASRDDSCPLSAHALRDRSCNWWREEATVSDVAVDNP